MSIFDFFRKKKETNPYKNMPPAFQKAFIILFPNGVTDHDRQLNELFKYYKGKYEKQDLDNNLIFVLTGYLITGNTTSRDDAINQVLNRPNNKMTNSEVEYLCDYALKNHPKLSQLLLAEAIMDKLSDDGCDTDTIPGGIGLFGLSAKNPIPTKGVVGIYDYLAHLYDSNGNPIQYERTGTVEIEISSHSIDMYKIISSKGEEILYFSAYHKRTSRLAPSGFILVDNNNVIVSTSNNREYPYGYKLNSITKLLPKLYGLNIYTCFSDKELEGKNERFVTAERINRQAIPLSNDGKYTEALMNFEKAISLGSLNAVNNKFGLLHTIEKYQEGIKHLESIIDTPLVTMQSLYNLAVLYYNGDNDTYYNLKKDNNKAYSLLLKAFSLPVDAREEYRERVRERVNSLITQLEKEL